MNGTLQEMMLEATRLTQAGRLDEATAVIQQALAGSGPASPGAAGPADIVWPMVPDLFGHLLGARNAAAADDDAGPIIDVGEAPVPRPAPPVIPPWLTPPRPARPADEDFMVGQHSHASLTRSYKLYVPPASSTAGARPALVVMLHGCAQDPDDFATGTGMNAIAREHGFFVLYPAQSHDANPQRCWNWFKHNHQARDRGEPAVIAAMTQAVVQEHGLDPRRVYIAGLSAGGAMAALVAAAYPDVFAAVGVHSGLPPGAARSLQEAMSAMLSGSAANGAPALAAQTANHSAAEHPLPRLTAPVIVFHGDQDGSVHPSNGDQVVAAALAARPADTGQPQVETGASPRGRRYTRSIHRTPAGRMVAEHWVVHGAGHGWSGGSPAGSFTDAQGPDASAEMLRFFLEHPLGASR